MSHRQWKCVRCATTYSRLEHLRRHLRSHEDQRPFECEYCSRAFTRRDVMRRHEKTCKAQTETLREPATWNARELNPAEVYSPSIPESAAQSVAAEGRHIFDNMPSSLDFSALDWLYLPQWPHDSISLGERLEYLAYFTSERGMGAFLDRDTLRQRQRLVLESEMNPNAESTIDPSIIHIGHNELDPLALTADEIVRQLQSIILSKPDKNVITLDWTGSTPESCTRFFTPANIRRFLEYFWSLWYPNCPIVHRPSFDPETAHTALVCVMAIIGACISPYEADARDARMWLDSVEELIFSNDCFREQLGGERADLHVRQQHRERQRLECVQMTYLVCSLQKREGSIEAQARIRRYRHATMVMFARDIGLGSASHRTLRLERPSAAWWKQFSAEEELIRALTYVFLFDAALTIFHNSPPRMVVSELKMDMACPESCFQAQTDTECFALLKEWEQSIFWRHNLSVVAVVRMMCQKDLDSPLVHQFARMGTLNMFTTVQSLHSLTFHLQNSMILEPTLTPVQTGLENWRRIWNERAAEDKDIPDHPRTIWKKIGFTCYAPEFWHLARIILDKIESDTTPKPHDSPRHHLAPKMDRYDHTDMMDVNGLIMEYRRLNLGVAT